MTAVAERAAISTLTLARSLRRTPAEMERLLEESCADGVVERTDGGWRLTARAEREFGPALRSLGDEQVVA